MQFRGYMPQNGPRLYWMHEATAETMEMVYMTAQ